MRRVKIFAFLLFVVFLALPMAKTKIVRGQSATEAPTGFDNQTNGFTKQQVFDADKEAFEEIDQILPDANQGGGLGPVYNAQGCVECHQNPVTGAISQIMELRAGHTAPDGTFVDAPGGSLIHARAIDALIQERVPDSSRIIFSRNADKMFVMGIDGGQYGEVANDPTGVNYAGFSGDTRKITFAKAVGGIKQIFVMNVDGTNQVQITNDPNGAFNPAWSPSGASIAFVSVRTGTAQIWSTNPDGTNQQNLTSDGIGGNDFPAWSPNSQKIAFQRTRNGQTDIWLMNANGSNQTNVTNGVNFTTNTNPSFSPSGTQIAFASNRDGNNEIYKTNLTGTAQVRLTNNPANDSAPAWSPEDLIAFQSTRMSATFKIFVMANDGSSPFMISNFGFNSDTFPHFSTDTGENIRTFRTSLNTLGDGFVEAIPDETIKNIAENQRNLDPLIHGEYVVVSNFEGAPVQLGKFGWKAQVSTLLSFSSDAYLNEQGITNRFLDRENSSLGRSVFDFDPPQLREPVPIAFEDNPDNRAGQQDIDAFARFMRSTKAPPRDRNLVPVDEVEPGSNVFEKIGCAICHVRTFITGTPPIIIFPGEDVDPSALANKIIHPFSDFLLHDIGTGDGIVQNGGETTKNKVRTPPLWGVRTRDRLMHDGGGSSSQPTNHGDQSFAFNEAILRHAGEATNVRVRFQALSDVEKRQLFKFLKSL